MVEESPKRHVTTTIILVEDEPIIGETLQSELEREGYLVLSARDGAQALQLLQENCAQLILLDMMLPKEDGASVLQQLRAMAHHKATPVIVLTNFDTDDLRLACLAYQPCEYLVKVNTSMRGILTKVREMTSLATIGETTDTVKMA